jgi:hypothetical protein
MPVAGRIIGVPVAFPFISSFKELVVFRTFVNSFSDGSFAFGFAEVVDDLVLQNSDQPGSFRAAAFEFFISFQRGQKGLLHDIFRRGIVSQTKDGVLEKIVAVIVQPSAGIGQLKVGLWLGQGHADDKISQVNGHSKSVCYRRESNCRRADNERQTLSRLRMPAGAECARLSQVRAEPGSGNYDRAIRMAEARPGHSGCRRCRSRDSLLRASVNYCFSNFMATEIHAIAQPGGLRTIVKDVPQMRATAVASYFDADHPKTSICFFDDVCL